MTKTLILISKLISSIINPKSGKFIRKNEDVIWFPIITINDIGTQMGISKNAEWVVEVSEGIHHLDKPQLYVYVMVLLEKSFGVVHEPILKLLKDLSIEEDPFLVFPFINIIKIGFEQGSDYWAELAFQWYDELPEKQKTQLKATLLKINSAKWASQKTRHKAKKELAKLCKN